VPRKNDDSALQKELDDDDDAKGVYKADKEDDDKW
jgi:hypothetical protein